MAHVKQAPYAKKMTDMMENVKACWAQFREQAEELSHERQLVMKKMIEKSSRMNGLGFNTCTSPWYQQELASFLILMK